MVTLQNGHEILLKTQESIKVSFRRSKDKLIKIWLEHKILQRRVDLEGVLVVKTHVGPSGRSADQIWEATRQDIFSYIFLALKCYELCYAYNRVHSSAR